MHVITIVILIKHLLYISFVSLLYAGYYSSKPLHALDMTFAHGGGYLWVPGSAHLAQAP